LAFPELPLEKWRRLEKYQALLKPAGKLFSFCFFYIKCSVFLQANLGNAIIK